MRVIVPLAFFALLLFGGIGNNGVSSAACKACHPLIYAEYYDSMHAKASVADDPVHRAVWKKHPLHKKGAYAACAKCHTPEHQDGKADAHEAISCLYCHQIADIQEGKKSNTNIMSTHRDTLYGARTSQKGQKDVGYEAEHSFFGFVTKKRGSPYHRIDFSNENYYNAKICTGCHSHKENKHGFRVCDSEIDGVQSDKNCIDCHMPKLQGSFTTLKDSVVHRYHGFSGVSQKPELAAKYIAITLQKEGDNNFSVVIKNGASHALLLHPLRLGELHVEITRKGKTVRLSPVRFVRLIGKEGKPTPPWIATETVKDTQIGAHQSRSVTYDYALQSGDIVEITLGFYKVNPKAAKKLGIEDKALTTFHILKKVTVTVE